jgi:hypothetical protein
MPNRKTSRRAGRLVLFTVADWALWAVGRGGDDEAEAAPDPWALDVELDEATGRPRPSKRTFSKRRLATTLAFTTLFFCGAAFSAGAGDLVVSAVEDDAATTTETTTEAAPEKAPAAEEEPAEAAPAPAAETAPEPEAAPAEEPATEGEEPAAPADEPSDPAAEPAEDPASEPADADDPAAEEDPSSDDSATDPAEDPAEEPSDDSAGDPSSGSGTGSGSDDKAAAGVAPVTADTAPADVDLEGFAFATLWLHRDMPDPTPPARRLKRSFAKDLVAVSNRAHVRWSLVLGVLRARGHRGRVPATRESLTLTARSLAQRHANQDEWRAVLSLSGRTAFADRATAIARYNRAVGLRALVRGLAASKARLERRVLGDDRVTLYAGGRWDIEHHRIDVRVLALLRYLAESHHEVTVSCLDSGHGLYARPGVVSAHKYGLAVDIAALEGETIVGHQQPGSVTERAVRNILLMPTEVRPKQVISLLGLGGPSFPLANHDDHIHVGY